MRLLFFIVTLAALVLYGRCARILGIFPAPGYSQFILTEPLMKELAKRGHEVTVICPHSPKESIENYKTIQTAEVIESDDGIDLFGLDSENLFSSISITYQFGYLLTEGTLKNKQVQELLHSQEKFDLVIMEQFFNEALKGFAAHFNAPLVLFCSQGSTEWSKPFMGIPPLPTLSAVTYTSHTNHMNFFQRFKNLLGTFFDLYYRNFVALPFHRDLVKKYFPKPMDFDNVIHNVSVMLLNSHVSVTENELLPYHAVEIGGFHISEKPLSPELKTILDQARDGAILFSLGSNLKSSELPKETQEALFRVFGKLKQKIIWKFEKDFPEKPSNVWIGKWLNQSDILAHPNLQLFITHGGLLSTTEAVFYGVPMLGIPVFADQKLNMARAVENGAAQMISFGKLSENSLGTAINEMLTNSKYQENARRLSNLIRDRVVRPLDLAMYWIEYAIRHKGVRFETAAARLSWFQVYMIDIVAFVLFNLLFAYCLLRYSGKLLCRKFFLCHVQKKVSANKKSKQKKH